MLTRLAPWLVTIIVVVFAGLTWRLAELRADALTLERDQARTEAAVAQSALAWQAVQTQAISQAMAQRDNQLMLIARSMAEKRHLLETLEHNDADTRAWADQPLPNGIAGWVRQLGTKTDASTSDEHGAVAPSRADSSPEVEK